MSTQEPGRPDMEPQAGEVEPGERENQWLARASGTAAAIALASVGLAYVASQAGVVSGDLEGGSAASGAGVHASLTVPSISSPQTAESATGIEVLVEPAPVVPEWHEPSIVGVSAADEPEAPSQSRSDSSPVSAPVTAPEAPAPAAPAQPPADGGSDVPRSPESPPTSGGSGGSGGGSGGSGGGSGGDGGGGAGSGDNAGGGAVVNDPVRDPWREWWDEQARQLSDAIRAILSHDQTRRGRH